MKCELCNDTGSLTTDGYLDCVACDVAIERAEFNKRLKEAGSMSVEDAAWWGRQDALAARWISVEDRLPEIDYEKPEYSRNQRALVVCSAGVLEMTYISNGFAATERGRKPRWEWQGRVAPWTPTLWMPMPDHPA